MNRNKCCAIENLTKVVEEGLKNLAPRNNCCDNKADKDAGNISDLDKEKWRERLDIKNNNLIGLEQDPTNFILNEDHLLIFEKSPSLKTDITNQVDTSTGKKIVKLKYEEVDNLQNVTDRDNKTTNDIIIGNYKYYNKEDFIITEENKNIQNIVDSNIVAGKNSFNNVTIVDNVQNYGNIVNIVDGFNNANIRKFYKNSISVTNFKANLDPIREFKGNNIKGSNIAIERPSDPDSLDKIEKFSYALENKSNEDPNYSKFHYNVSKQDIRDNNFFGYDINIKYTANRNIFIGESIDIASAYSNLFIGRDLIKKDTHFFNNVLITRNMLTDPVYIEDFIYNKDGLEIMANCFYLGGTFTPLLTGNLGAWNGNENWTDKNKWLKVWGQLKIDGYLPKNNVQGDLSYTKKVVAKPDGTLGLVDNNSTTVGIVRKTDISRKEFRESRGVETGFYNTLNLESYKIRIDETSDITNVELTLHPTANTNNFKFKFIPTIFYLKGEEIVLYFSRDSLNLIRSLLESEEEIPDLDIVLTYIKQNENSN